MNVLWNKPVEMKDLWMPDCFGLFVKQEEQVTFFFKNRRELLSISEEDDKPRLLHSFCGNIKFRLPHKWAVVDAPNAAYLLVSDDCGFSLKNNEFSYDIPDEIRLEHSQHVRPEKYLVEDPQQLGEFTILHKGNCGYICKKETLKLHRILLDQRPLLILLL